MVRISLSAVMALVTIGALGTMGASLSGCVVAAAGGAGVAGYAVLAEDLPPKQQLRDYQIKAECEGEWGAFRQEMAHRLEATVFDGQVLITGRVPNRRWREEAVKGAWRVRGVHRVFDEIGVGPDSRFIDSARDTWITTQLRGELIADIDVKSINYTITTYDRVLYVLGVARTRRELDRVIGHARTIAGVRRVSSFVNLLGTEPGAAPPREEQLNRPPLDDEDNAGPSSGPGPDAGPADEDRGAPPPPPPPPSSGGGPIKAEPLGGPQ